MSLESCIIAAKHCERFYLDHHSFLYMKNAPIFYTWRFFVNFNSFTASSASWVSYSLELIYLLSVEKNPGTVRVPWCQTTALLARTALTWRIRPRKAHRLNLFAAFSLGSPNVSVELTQSSFFQVNLQLKKDVPYTSMCWPRSDESNWLHIPLAGDLCLATILSGAKIMHY